MWTVGFVEDDDATHDTTGSSQFGIGHISCECSHLPRMLKPDKLAVGESEPVPGEFMWPPCCG